MDITPEKVRNLLDSTDGVFPIRVTVKVEEDSTAWNPASTSSVIHGPCQVTYSEYVDGGIEAKVLPLLG